MKHRKKTQGPIIKKDTGTRGRDHSYEGDRGLGEVPSRTQPDPHYGPGGAVDKTPTRRKLRRR